MPALVLIRFGQALVSPKAARTRYIVLRFKLLKFDDGEIGEDRDKAINDPRIVKALLTSKLGFEVNG